MPLPLRALAPLALLAACSAPPATAPAPADAASAPVAAATPAPAPPPPPPTASAAPPPSAEPAPSTVPSAAPAASATPAAEAPLPAVKVSNIGMHIGGGPNDDVTKDPIRRSVQPHFDAFRRCFAQVEEKKTGDYGVDLRIQREGGKAQVSHPRTALKGKDFKECVVKVFEGIDFLKPRGGTTTVSYSLRFTPAKEGS
jgi:pyruvate/2-oxoglutarate dehydrogenase complex dihydrolipoamide acyltransferase (E2) component